MQEIISPKYAAAQAALKLVIVELEDEAYVEATVGGERALVEGAYEAPVEQDIARRRRRDQPR